MGLQFLKLMLRSDGSKDAASESHGERSCSFEDERTVQLTKSSKQAVVSKTEQTDRDARFDGATPIWQPRRNCGPVPTDLLLCFLCRHAGVNRGATSPFHTSVRGQTQTPPPERGLCSVEEFHVWDGNDYSGLGRRVLPASAVQGTGSGERSSSVIALRYLPVMRQAG